MVIYPFWKDVLAPLIEAAEAQHIVEVGALRGENTTRMLKDLPGQAELHVIDPAPAFDTGTPELSADKRYVFHRDLSLNVLPHLGAIDVALIDGDHNWYTVYHELNILQDLAAERGTPLPVLVLHDVLWPHGRRDQYYNPATIPEEYRKPYREYRVDGEVVCNAVEEGGPRNGVMCALKDFLSETGRSLRVVLIPIYHGLAIAVERDELARKPRLLRFLDWLESAEGRFSLLKLSEEIRVRDLLLREVGKPRS